MCGCRFYSGYAVGRWVMLSIVAHDFALCCVRFASVIVFHLTSTNRNLWNKIRSHTGNAGIETVDLISPLVREPKEPSAIAVNLVFREVGTMVQARPMKRTWFTRSAPNF